MPRYYYNTNGFAHHRLQDAVAILAELGYAGIALTPDVHHLDPWSTEESAWRAFGRMVADHGLDLVVETGARFVLDARRKHRPNLLDDEPDRSRRLAFLRRMVDLAAAVGAPIVSVWSGTLPTGVATEVARERLVGGLQQLIDASKGSGTTIGFEPEPGMWIEEIGDWPQLRDDVARERLRLVLDVGHCLAVGETTPDEAIRRHGKDLALVHLDDHRKGRHEHLAFGEGEVDFAAIGRALRDVGFDGPLEVELGRHGADAPRVAAASIEYLRAHLG